MQTDPIGYGDGMNWYNYVHSDPVNETDPSGECPGCDGTTQTAAFSAAASGLSGGVGSGQSKGPDITEITVTASANAIFWHTLAANEAKVQIYAGIDEAAGLATGPGEIPNQAIAAGIEIVGTINAINQASKAAKKAKALAFVAVKAPHGNSYKSVKKTWVYALINSSNGALLKYGITSEPDAEDRYSRTFYKNLPIKMDRIQQFDDRATARAVEVGLCGAYTAFHGSLPPLSAHC